MKGDFSRMTFDPAKHFSRVLQQQGRVQLDADWNEQVAILLHHVRTLTADLLGTGAGPVAHCGFAIGNASNSGNGLDFTIGRGRYYVHGILCQNDADGVTYLSQPDLPGAPPLPGDSFIVYLDVWERFISALEDNTIREVALGGPDTAGRTKVVWQVRSATGSDWDTVHRGLVNPPRGRLLVQPVVPSAAVDNTQPCSVPPDASYRGPENQLYRVEIHTSGAPGTATFKWSRENGCAVMPVLGIEPSGDAATVTVSLANLGRDDRLGLSVTDWVELVDDDAVLQNRSDALLQVQSIDRDAVTVTLAGTSAISGDADKHPLLRRWDQQPPMDPKTGKPATADNAVTVPVTKDAWVPLEDGVQVAFDWDDDATAAFRTGDYWLVPLRTATGLADWPACGNVGCARGPDGVDHHYAPLALITSPELTAHSLRCEFAPAPCEYGSYPASQGIGAGLL